MFRMKKEILRVYAEKNEETGKVSASWVFPNKTSAFIMKGILMSIVHDLNDVEIEEYCDNFEE